MSGLRLRPRLTIRLRLTLLYFTMFFLAGTVLIALNYGLLVRTAYQPLSGTSAPPQVVVRGGTGSGPSETAPNLQPLIKGLQRTNQIEAQLRAQLRDQAIQQMLVQSLGVLVVAACMSVALAWIAAGRALQPIQSIARAARHAAAGSLGERVNLAGPRDELKDLADTIDGMLARLESAFDGQRRFAANVSHELRTPLTILRTAVDVTLENPDSSRETMRRMALEVREAAERAERLIDSLLVLARSEERVRVTEPADLADSAQDALDALAGLARELDLRVDLAIEDAPVLGDRVLLDRMVGNLVENAFRYNQPGGSVWVATGVEDDRSFARVSNTGPVIPDDVVPTLFERFRRLQRIRTGSDRGAGLGLSIVSSVVSNHGGEVTARPRAGGGLELLVRLPTACREVPAGARAPAGRAS